MEADTVVSLRFIAEQLARGMWQLLNVTIYPPAQERLQKQRKDSFDKARKRVEERNVLPPFNDDHQVQFYFVDGKFYEEAGRGSVRDAQAQEEWKSIIAGIAEEEACMERHMFP